MLYIVAKKEKNQQDIAVVNNYMGLIYQCLGEYKKALKYYNKALKKTEKIYATEHLNTAIIYNNILMPLDGLFIQPPLWKAFTGCFANIQRRVQRTPTDDALLKSVHLSV